MTAIYIAVNGKKNGSKSDAAIRFRLGDRVRNSNHGNGVVRAFNPNGSLVVRFEGQNKSKSVFPTFLERAAG